MAQNTLRGLALDITMPLRVACAVQERVIDLALTVLFGPRELPRNYKSPTTSS